MKRVRVKSLKRRPRHPDALREAIYEQSKGAYVKPPLFHWRATFKRKNGETFRHYYSGMTYEEAKERALAIVELYRKDIDQCWLIRE